MRRPPITAAILTAGACALGLGAPATAQTPEGRTTPQAAPSSANAAALRYLSWPGRTYPPAEAAPLAGAAPAAVTTPRRPAIIPHGGWTPPEAAPPQVAPQAAPLGLTPAPAWIASQPPAYPPPPAPSAAPRAYVAETAEPAPLPAAPAAAPAAASDPMAPRRDALIFRLQQPAAAPQIAPQPAPAPDAPAAAAAQGDGARYYSVHRQNGRQPDATPLPAPVYLDALPVDLTAMPASTDLAEPPAAPNLIRNANGRLQALPANEDPVLP